MLSRSRTFAAQAELAVGASAMSLDEVYRRYLPYVAKLGYRLLGGGCGEYGPGTAAKHPAARVSMAAKRHLTAASVHPRDVTCHRTAAMPPKAAG